MQIQPEFVYPAAATVCASIGAVTDVRSRRVPNWLRKKRVRKKEETKDKRKQMRDAREQKMS